MLSAPLRRAHVGPAILAFSVIAPALFGAGPMLAKSRAPAPIHVALGEALDCAERAAREHEGDFAPQGIGRSMEPLYLSGTAIVVHPTELHMLRPGMAVVYRKPGGTCVAHVLLEKNGRGWLVTGVNNREPDGPSVTETHLG